MVLTWLFTNLPTGLHCWMRRRYSLILASCSAKDEKDTPKLPNPRSAASSSVPGLVTATHIGGCGFWYGLGSIARRGIEKNVPSYPKRSSVHIRGRTRTNSSHERLVSSGSAWKPASSVHV